MNTDKHGWWGDRSVDFWDFRLGFGAGLCILVQGSGDFGLGCPPLVRRLRHSAIRSQLATDTWINTIETRWGDRLADFGEFSLGFGAGLCILVHGSGDFGVFEPGRRRSRHSAKR